MPRRQPKIALPPEKHRPRPHRHRHPANVARHDRQTRGIRAADAVTTRFGSWPYLIIQTVVVLAWIAVNVTAYMSHWDPYPFILLNLLFSTQASYAAPLILLSQNVQAEHDRARAEEDFACNTRAETKIENAVARLERVEQILLSRR